LFVPFLGVNRAFAAAPESEGSGGREPRRRLEWRADLLVA
jgi:tRNA(Ile)-lysidine synthase